MEVTAMSKKRSLVLSILVAAFLIVSLQVLAIAGSNNYVGYLSDVMCATKGVAGEEGSIQANPERHAVECMKMPRCDASGYGIFIKDPESDKYVFYKFDEKGSGLAKELLKNTQKAEDIHIKVTGTMHEDKIMVESIIEG